MCSLTIRQPIENRVDLWNRWFVLWPWATEFVADQELLTEPYVLKATARWRWQNKAAQSHRRRSRDHEDKGQRHCQSLMEQSFFAHDNSSTRFAPRRVPCSCFALRICISVYLQLDSECTNRSPLCWLLSVHQWRLGSLLALAKQTSTCYWHCSINYLFYIKTKFVTKSHMRAEDFEPTLVVVEFGTPLAHR